VDDEDRLKRQARRRLIGAVALITAVVVVLPMVLDSEPKPVGQNIELRIPDRDKAGAFDPKISAGAMASASAPLAAPVVAASASSTPPAVAAAPAPVLTAAPAAKPAAAAPAPAKPDAKTAPPAASKPALETAKAPAPAKPEAKATAQKPTDAKSAAPSAVPSAKTPPAKVSSANSPSARTGFVVQVGAFANANTAHSWQKNFISQGFKAYTEKAGNKTRVRIGPYSTREAANKARKKLEEKGLHVNVVDLGEK
jgi:DedD protein